MKRSDSILQKYYMSKLPKAQNGKTTCPPGFVNVEGKCFDRKSKEYKDLYEEGIGYLDKTGTLVSSKMELPEVVVKPESVLNFLDKTIGTRGNSAMRYAFNQLGKKYGFPEVKSQEEYAKNNSFSFFSLPDVRGHYWNNTIYADEISTYLSELAHHLMTKEKGRVNQIRRWIGNDLIDYATGNNPYKTKGSIEYEAHRIVEPKLRREFTKYWNKYHSNEDDGVEDLFDYYRQGGSLTKAQNGLETDNLQKAIDWYKTWYGQRKVLPQFQTLAQQRLQGLEGFLPKIVPTPATELNKIGAVAEYIPRLQKGKLADIIRVMDPSTVGALQKELETKTGIPLKYNIESDISTDPNVMVHELGHFLDQRFPQSATRVRTNSAGRDKNYELYPLSTRTNFVHPKEYIQPGVKGRSAADYDWITSGQIPTLRTEFNSTLNTLRKIEGLRGDKPTTPEQMQKIIDKYKNLSEEKLIPNTKEGNINNTIRMLIDSIGADANKLSDYNNRIVMGNTNRMPIAKNGGKLIKFQKRRGQVSLYDLAQKLESEKRIGRNVGSISTPTKQSTVLTQLSPKEIYYANQLNKYGRTKEDIERSRKEAELPFLLATGAIAAPLAGLSAASALPAIGAGLSYAPIASAPAATLGNLLTSAGVASAVTNLPNTGRSIGQAVKTGNISDIGEAALNVGLTGVDLLPAYGPIAQTARNVAQHPLVSTLPYVVQNRAIKDYLGAAAFATINRAAPILSKTPVLKDIYKGAAERIASASLGQTRDLSQIIRALTRKNLGSYKGMTSIPESGYSVDRNLVRNYIYGDARGFEQSDIPLINLNKYINRYGPLKKYKLDASQLQDKDYPFEFLAQEASDNNQALKESLRGLETSEEIIDKLKEIARREGMVGIGSESNKIGFDDIAGHMKYLIHDPVTDTYKVRTQDIWKFTPEDYNPKWLSEAFNKRSFNKNKIDLKTYLSDYMKSKQASLMDKAGKPFVTLDERPLAITKREERFFQPLDIKFTDYTPQELEEMGLSPAEIKDVLAKSKLKLSKLKLSDWDLSMMTQFDKQPMTEFSNKIKDLNFADLVDKKSRLKRKQGGPIVNSNGYKNGRPPKGSNWRIPSDTLYNPTPHKLLAISDKGEAQILNPFDNRLKKFTDAEYIDEYEMRDGGLPKFQQRPGTYRPLNELTDAEKRNLAKRIVTNARRRIETGQYFDVPESLKKTKEAQREGAYGCIGGACSIYAEEGAIPKAIWSNTDFSLLAPELGFPNRGWGLRGIDNLEPGDIMQWMDVGDKNPNTAYPHHAQIFLGINPETGYYDFFDNYAKDLKSYPKETVEDKLKPGKEEYESQGQIYKVNPYSIKTDPTTRANIRKRQKENIEYEINNPIPYEYSLTPDSQFRSPNASGNIADPSPIPKDLPEGVQKFFEFVNNPENTKNLLRKLGELKYFNRATNEDIHDSYLNVFGILGQENKWADRWFGGSYGGLENTGEKILKPKNASLGPGQIKFSNLTKEWRKEFGIKSPKDLYKWEKILPLMTALDISNKQIMQNQGENFSERIIGESGLASNEMKWDEGRLSPYFYRGPGAKNIRENLRERYVKKILRNRPTGMTSEGFTNFGVGDSWQNETDDIRWSDAANNYITENIRKEQKVFDPGSYGRNVWENWARNIQRQMPVQYKQTIPARQIYNEVTKQWENIPAQEPIPLMLPEVVIGQKKLGGLTFNKAREILHHGMAHGNKLTDKQRRYFGFMSKGNTKKY